MVRRLRKDPRSEKLWPRLLAGVVLSEGRLGLLGVGPVELLQSYRAPAGRPAPGQLSDHPEPHRLEGGAGTRHVSLRAGMGRGSSPGVLRLLKIRHLQPFYFGKQLSLKHFFFCSPSLYLFCTPLKKNKKNAFACALTRCSPSLTDSYHGAFHPPR